MNKLARALTAAALGLVTALAIASPAQARPVIEEDRYCGPGYDAKTCEPLQTNDCVVWYLPWTWNDTTCVP